MGQSVAFIHEMFRKSDAGNAWLQIAGKGLQA